MLHPSPRTVPILVAWSLAGIDVACRTGRDRRWAHSGIMRYHDCGGLSTRARDKREAVRMQAATWFADGVSPTEAAVL
ncbi:hypothetical protein Vau01_016410 [Virgisporangium aurantiacum]|uniref:Uncharacterized protein n=1 Tax=Virgisporangium aurantiacum TaxID=175570 RepID=A0A8J3Z324_9ACTN|nr:hypothetical protein Vau01_016410 [Virgisporangium aurantiacum]